MKINLSPRMFEYERIKRCRLEECKGACCLYGVWLDELEVQDLIENAGLIIPYMPEDYQTPSSWFDDRTEEDAHSLSGTVIHSLVVEDHGHYGDIVCVFSMADRKCALQVAGEAAGYHPWRFKPFYCILHPLDLDDEGNITLDDAELMVTEPASCLRVSQEPVQVFEVFLPELRYLLGEKKLDQIITRWRASGNV